MRGPLGSPEAGLVHLAGRAERLASRRSVAGAPGRSTRRTDQYYLHLFLPEQPDLNWRNPEVVEAMHGILRFWLDRGVDGFRIDVAALYRQGSELRRPSSLAGRGAPLSDFN